MSFSQSKWRRDKYHNEPEWAENIKKQSRKYRKEHPGKDTKYQRRMHKKYPQKRMFLHARNRASKRGIVFNLMSWKDLPGVPDICPVLGIKIRVISGTGHYPNAPSLDRIDASKGYEIGNLRMISRRANELKSNASPQEMILLGKDGKRLLRRRKT